MSVISFRRRPKRQPKHALFTEPEKSLPEMLAELAPDLEPVPHGDAVIPEGATPAEDFPVGVHPFDVDAPKTLRERAEPDWRQRQPVRSRGGMRHTEPFSPDFAEEGARPRPYARRNMPRPWLVPDTWRRRSHPLTQQGHDLTGFVREHMSAVTYPGPRALPSEAAAFFRRISTITGTRSSFEQAPRCVAWAPAIDGPVSAVATGPQRRLTEPTFTPHIGRAA